MTKTYVKDYTNTFEIKGETIEVTAPARFDSKTNKIIDDNVIGWSPLTITLYEVGEIPTKSFLIKPPQAMKDFIEESEDQEEL